MIQSRTVLKVTDNSGAKTVRCIKVLGGFRRKQAKLGDIVVVSVQKLRKRPKNESKVKKKEVRRAIIVRTKIKNYTESGIGVAFSGNSAVIIDKQGNPTGTRVIGPLSRLLKRKFQKLASISAGMV